MIPRFGGTVEVLGAVPIDEVRAWIQAIPFEDWPQQHPVGGRIRPAMVNDQNWHRFGAATDDLVAEILYSYVSGLVPAQRMLSVVMPGHSIPPHSDRQNAAWRMRVHIPLVADPPSLFWYGDEPYSLLEGIAYKINTEREHSIVNDTPHPRIHFMVDMIEWP